MKPGDPVETVFGDRGILEAFESVVLPDRYGRPVDETAYWVRLLDGRLHLYLPGTVHPAHDQELQ